MYKLHKSKPVNADQGRSTEPARRVEAEEGMIALAGEEEKQRMAKIAAMAEVAAQEHYAYDPKHIAWPSLIRAYA